MNIEKTIVEAWEEVLLTAEEVVVVKEAVDKAKAVPTEFVEAGRAHFLLREGMMIEAIVKEIGLNKYSSEIFPIV